MSSALAGLHVLDLSDSVGGQYCSRLLSDYGARVVLVEDLDGSVVRRAPGWTANRPAAEDSELFRHLNAGKSSLALTWTTPAGREVLGRLASTADVVIAADENLCRRLHGDNGHLVACHISDFGRGPHQSWTGSEMIFQALSGVMLLNGQPPRRPLYGIGHRAQYSAGITAYGSILAAILARDASHRGQIVRTSVFEAVAAMNGVSAARYLYNGTCEGRDDGPGLLALLRCCDAWVVLYAARDADWHGCCAVFDLPQYRDDPRFVDLADRFANWQLAIELLAPKATAMSAADVVAAGRACKLPVSQVMDTNALVKDPHLTERGFWVDGTGPDGVTTLGPPFRMNGTPRVALGVAPTLGQDNATILSELGIGPDEYRSLQASGVIR
jgi:crotonobetainyl-CoA:carnitine CoA-transferase CaiB-like acyl-CoA transferase